MSFAICYTRANCGIKAPLVRVEAHISPGNTFTVVGLPESSIRESRFRVRSAITNSCFRFPNMCITVNLAPADLPKEGSRYDLAIALAILAASQQIPHDRLLQYEFFGELALTGEIQAIYNILPSVISAKSAGSQVILPSKNAYEVSLVNHTTAYPADHLLHVCDHLHGENLLSQIKSSSVTIEPSYPYTFEDISGHEFAKKSLMIAAAGHHSTLFIGPPGGGKTLLASSLPSIMPPLTNEEALDIASVQSLLRNDASSLHSITRPFRAPHHTSSSVALIGGGSPIHPGEISLAHLGILFLDELPEFNRKVLETLREPLESGYINISRANDKITLPARFLLVAAMNPCPCGFHGDPRGRCRCSAEKIQRYRQRISGPFLERMDQQVAITPIQYELLSQDDVEKRGLSTEEAKEIIKRAQQIQFNRQGCLNSSLKPKQLRGVCPLSSEAMALLKNAWGKLILSGRSYHRTLKTSRTIADLDDSEEIQINHVSEALCRRFIRQD